MIQDHPRPQIERRPGDELDTDPARWDRFNDRIDGWGAWWPFALIVAAGFGPWLVLTILERLGVI